MKKSLLLFSVLGMGTLCFAQTSGSSAPHIVQVKHQKAVPFKNIRLGNENTNFPNTNQTAPKTPQVNSYNPVPNTAAVQIGTTVYNFGTNRSVRNALVNNSDGTVSSVFIFSNNYSAGAFPDRGTGYVYYNGTSWGPQPSARIESARVGWANIATFSDGSEMIVTHNTASTKTQINRRPAKGTGAWSADDITSLVGPNLCGTGGMWPRLVAGGPTGMSAHIIAVADNGTTSPAICKGQTDGLRYYHSPDAGVTWDQIATIIAGTDSASGYDGFGGDSYAIDAKGNDVAIAVGNSTTDLLLLKSTDDGTTWTKTVINNFPLKHYATQDSITDWTGPNTPGVPDGTPDTMSVSDESVSVLLDDNGMAHVWYGNMSIIGDGTGAKGSYGYFPATNGLMYWNESMGAATFPTLTNAVMITGALDLNSNGILDFDTVSTCVSPQSPFGTYYTSLSSHPTSGIDASGWIYLAYDAAVENTSNGATPCPQAFRQTYVMVSKDHGVTWSTPYNIYNDAFTESVYPSMARAVDNTNGPCLINIQDDIPGFGIGNASADPANDGHPAGIWYSCTSLSGINENSGLNISTVYPNPTIDNATLEVTSTHASKVAISIYNVMGQKVKEVSSSIVVGKNIIHLDLRDLSSGLYTMNMVAGKNIASTKIMKQ